MRTGLWRHAAVSPDVAKYCLYGGKLGVRTGRCQLPMERFLPPQQSRPLRRRLLGSQVQTPLCSFHPLGSGSSRCPASSPFFACAEAPCRPVLPALVLTCWVAWEIAWLSTCC